MAKFILSAFADEASPVFDEQLRILQEEGITLVELRGADGKNCADLTLEEAAILRRKHPLVIMSMTIREERFTLWIEAIRLRKLNWFTIMAENFW